MPGFGKLRLLCEGWLDDGIETHDHQVFYPARGYVEQGDKLWIAFGDKGGLDESVTEGHTIVESMDELELETIQVSEGRTVRLPKNGRWVVEGPAQRSDVRNANKRVYGRGIWEKLIADEGSYVQQAIKERALIGHTEHPKDGRTDLNEASILTTSSKLLEDGTVFNQFELLNTSKGRDLQALTADGVRWGVSSRGAGTVDDAGKVNENDYVLKAWDAVAAPSTPKAFTTLVTHGESKEDADKGKVDEGKTQPDEDTDRDLEAAIDQALESAEGDSLAGFTEVLHTLQEQVSDSVTENADLRMRLEAAESRCESLRAERDTFAEQLSESQGELTRSKRERDLAFELLEAAPGSMADGRVAEAVEEALGETPELERYREVLEGLSTPDEVQRLVEELKPVVAVVETSDEPDPEPPPARRQRNSLPVGVVESTDVGRFRQPASNPSPGARLAGKVLRNLQKTS